MIRVLVIANEITAPGLAVWCVHVYGYGQPYDLSRRWLGTSWHATRLEAEIRAARLRAAGKYLRTSEVN